MGHAFSRLAVSKRTLSEEGGQVCWLSCVGGSGGEGVELRAWGQVQSGWKVGCPKRGFLKRMQMRNNLEVEMSKGIKEARERESKPWQGIEPEEAKRGPSVSPPEPELEEKLGGDKRLRGSDELNLSSDILLFESFGSPGGGSQPLSILKDEDETEHEKEKGSEISKKKKSLVCFFLFWIFLVCSWGDKVGKAG